MTAPALHLAGRLHSGETTLIDAFDLKLPAEQWSVLLGPSGVGKTSLLRLIAALPSAARLDGDITACDGAPIASRVTMMAQDDQLLPWASAVDNVTICVQLSPSSSSKIAFARRATPWSSRWLRTHAKRSRRSEVDRKPGRIMLLPESLQRQTSTHQISGSR